MSVEATIEHERSEPAKDIRESFNIMLREKYGLDPLSGLPNWRVAWAPSLFNKQYGTFRDFTENGLFIREVTEVREVPKYNYLKDLYVLERLMPVPSQNEHQLPGAALTYECMHPYMHKVNKTYLPPNWVFTEWVIDCYYAHIGTKSLRKYLSDEGTDVPESLRGIEAKRKRVAEITAYLYGNETSTTDAMSYGSGVVNKSEPHHFKE